MTLTVEDGTGLSNADAYVSTATADTYFTNLGNTSWTGSSTEKEIAIRKATSYLDATYNWVGEIFSLTQSLNWPRTGATDSQGRNLDESVPQLVKNACCELSVLALTGALVSDITSANYVKREKVGELEVEYSDSAPATTQYSYVDRLLSGVSNGKLSGGSSLKLVRV